jgi:hypothetical protein
MEEAAKRGRLGFDLEAKEEAANCEKLALKLDTKKNKVFTC